ncbi:MAG: hypothetical protein WCY54_03840 [Syntrophales bacterium]
MNIQIFDIRVPFEHSEKDILAALAAMTGMSPEEIGPFRIVRKSLDARGRRPPSWLYSVRFSASREPAFIKETGKEVKYKITEDESPPGFAAVSPPEKRPVVIGCGPAGLFGAYALASSGVPVLLLEKGRKIETRRRDVEAFWKEGLLEQDSNVHFGEGGAGAFSDGKLTTRVRSGFLDMIKKSLVDFGAPPEILYDAKPHIGTDKLREVVGNFRRGLAGMGCEIRFGAKVTGILAPRGVVEGLVVNGREEIPTGHILLAAGQSSPEVYRILEEIGADLEPKAFAMGLRIEHLQETINGIQYGAWSGLKGLPPADYFLTAGPGGPARGVYSFCMCPGGCVIASSSEEGGVVTNGMSLHRRNGAYANSAIVANVRPGDFGSASPLAGLEFRKFWERRAFTAAGGDYRAPAQGLLEFLQDKYSGRVGHASYRPGVKPVPLRDVLPHFLTEALKQGLLRFGEKMPGFISPEANLIGVETRTSSPVRITRREDGRSRNIAGLYPCGEGSGYAGGIMSSALDGIRGAQAILKNLEKKS